MSRQNRARNLDSNFALGCGSWNGLPVNTYISIYAKMNRCYKERGSITNYVRSSILHCTSPHNTISLCKGEQDCNVDLTEQSMTEPNSLAGEFWAY